MIESATTFVCLGGNRQRAGLQLSV